MLQITIENRVIARELIATQPEAYKKIISLVDINSPVVSVAPHHLVVTVTDIVEIPERFRGPYINPRKMPVLPNLSHIEAILGHTADVVDGDHLLIHCSAGKSRSTAAALAVLMQHGMPYTDALVYLETIRPQMLPNQLMVALIDERFGLNGALRMHYNEWYFQKVGLHNLLSLLD